MKNTQASEPQDNNVDNDLLPEYDFDYRKARLNRFATQTSKAPSIQTLLRYLQQMLAFRQ